MILIVHLEWRDWGYGHRGIGSSSWETGQHPPWGLPSQRLRQPLSVSLVVDAHRSYTHTAKGHQWV